MRKILMLTVIVLFSLTALAQTPDKPQMVNPASVAPIAVPEPEAGQLKALIVEANKAQAEFVDTAQKALTARDQKLALLQPKWNTLLVQAGAKSGLGLTELSAMAPQLDEKGNVVWVKRPEPPKEAPKEKQ